MCCAVNVDVVFAHLIWRHGARLGRDRTNVARVDCEYVVPAADLVQVSDMLIALCHVVNRPQSAQLPS
jgi:hypothetical protein